MTFTNHLLSLSIWLPIVFGVIILAIGRDERPGMTRVLALVASIISLRPTLALLQGFDNAAHGMQFVESTPWIGRFNIFYSLAIDGLSLWFVPLTAFITIIVIISAW